MRRCTFALAAATAAAGLILTGCQLPEGSAGAGAGPDAVDESHDISTRGHVVGRDAGGDPIFADPRDNALYDEMTRPLPHSGGDLDGPCGAWEAATPELAAQQRELHQRCLDGDIDLTGDARW